MKRLLIPMALGALLGLGLGLAGAAAASSNSVTPNGYLRVTWHYSKGNPAKFTLKPVPKPGHTGEIVVVVECWAHSNPENVRQVVVQGAGGTPVQVPVGGLVDKVEFHWISGNARSLTVTW